MQETAEPEPLDVAPIWATAWRGSFVWAHLTPLETGSKALSTSAFVLLPIFRPGHQEGRSGVDARRAIQRIRRAPGLRLEEVAEPPGANDVLIKVNAVGLNFFDTLVLRNQYQVTPPLPFSPGAEVAGEIRGFGANVTDAKIGQRVVAFIGGNGCQEKVVTKAKNAIPIPDGVSDEVAAGIPVTYGTAIHALKDRAQLKAGESVAVLGAAGGAGVAAIEIAKLMGARVIAVASSGDKLAFAREHGADEGINYETEDLKTQVEGADHAERRGRALRHGRRPACRAEPAGDGLGRALSRARLCLGHDSEDPAQSSAAQGVRHDRSVLDLVRRARSGAASRQHGAAARLVQTREDSPHVHASFALIETAKALALIEGRKVTGKVIVNPQR